MKPEFHPNIPAELSQIRPLYDFVLVKRLPDDGARVGSLYLPQNRKDAEDGARRGIVLACGPGDKVTKCPNCPGGILKCGVCMDERRHEMNVQPGDIVLYQRVPANVVTIDDEEYTLCHEEQHIIAVLEGAD